MADIRKIADSSAPRQPPRSGIVELMQLGSLFALGVALLLLMQGWPWPYYWGAFAPAVILCAVPFLLTQLPQREQRRLPDSSLGFEITPARRRTLAELGVPADILLVVDESILGKFYSKGKELRDALYLVLGEERVRPWLDVILLHARIYGDLPAPKDDVNAQPEWHGAVGEKQRSADYLL